MANTSRRRPRNCLFFTKWKKQLVSQNLYKKNTWTKYHCEYWEKPEFANIEWVQEMKQNLGEKGWRQEVLQEFLSQD